MKRYLTAKHWQLFILIIVIPWLLLDLILSSVISESSTIIMSVSTALFWGWLWTVGSNAATKLPPNVRMNLNYFRIAFFTPLVVFGVVGVLRLSSDVYADNFKFLADKLGILVPLLLLAVFCVLYVIGFVAKVLKTVELDRKVTLQEYFIDCILLWVYPIGMWIIQPRVNRLLNK